MQIQELIQKFHQLYGDSGNVRVFFAPGRVNLIGDHTDYNGGHVFPCALTLGTYAVIRPREDNKVRFSSLDIEPGQVREISLSDLTYHEEEGWISYPKGVLWAFHVRGNELPCGFDILYAGNIPLKAGISSSSSVECVTAFAVNELFQLNLNAIDMAVLAQRAETRFIGHPCSIMDQISAMVGRAGCGIFLTVSSMRYEYVPLTLGSVRIVVTNSMIRHDCVDKVSAERKAECQKALKKIQVLANVIGLGDLSTDAFASCKDVLMDETLVRRVRHVVYENARTIQAVNALRVKDLRRFGSLMNDSHRSLKMDYEVSCDELDTLVETAQSIEGVLGSRMTGAGFGGCTVSLVENDVIPAFRDRLTAVYKEKFGLIPDFYIADAGDGAKEIPFE